MSGFLLDTNIISELVKPKPEANVTEWVENIDESLLYLSVFTLGEIRRGIAALPQSRRRATLGLGSTRISAHASTAESWSLTKKLPTAGAC